MEDLHVFLHGDEEWYFFSLQNIFHERILQWANSWSKTISDPAVLNITFASSYSLKTRAYLANILQNVLCMENLSWFWQKWSTAETHPLLEARTVTSDIPWNSTMRSSRILAWLCCAVLTLSDDKCSIPDVLGICSWSYCELLFFCHLTFCHIWNVETGQALLPAFWYR